MSANDLIRAFDVQGCTSAGGRHGSRERPRAPTVIIGLVGADGVREWLDSGIIRNGGTLLQ